jgi:hypothetical protein
MLLARLHSKPEAGKHVGCVGVTSTLYSKCKKVLQDTAVMEVAPHSCLISLFMCKAGVQRGETCLSVETMSQCGHVRWQ